MGAAALQQAQLDAADLGASALFQDFRQHTGQTAQLGMAKAVGSGGLGLGYKAAIGIVDALRDGNQHFPVGGIDPLHIGNELLHVKVQLRQIDQIGAGAKLCGQGGAGGQPTGVAAHDLHHGDHAIVIDTGILIDFHAGSGNIFGSAGKARAVVGAEQVVVNGLGNAHDPAVVTNGLHITADLVAGIHGIVAAVVEEVSHIIFLENLKNPLIVRVILLRICNFVAAGAQLGRGGVQQQLQLSRVFLVHDVQLVIQNAADTMGSAVNRSNFFRVKRGTDNAVCAGVDDSGRSAGLTKNAGTNEFFRHVSSSNKSKNFMRFVKTAY